jgi:hypothetical protein
MIAGWDHKIGEEKGLEGLLPARSYLLYSKKSDYYLDHWGNITCSNSWEFGHLIPIKNNIDFIFHDDNLPSLKWHIMFE